MVKDRGAKGNVNGTMAGLSGDVFDYLSYCEPSCQLYSSRSRAKAGIFKSKCANSTGDTPPNNAKFIMYPNSGTNYHMWRELYA